MKKLLLALFISTISTLLTAQTNTSVVNWEWTNTYGNDSSSVANNIVVDDSLNLYVSGLFRDTLIVENDTIFGQVNNDSPFISKWNELGDLLWINNIEWGWAYDINAIRLDTNNNLYVLGDNVTLLVYDGLNGGIITYYNLVSAINGVAGERIQNIRFNSDNELVILSEYDGPSFEKITRLTKCSLSNHTIANIEWDHDFISGDLTMGGVYDFSMDINDMIYLAGTTYNQELTIQNDIIISTSAPTNTQIFTAKYNTTGEAIWLDTLSANFCEVIGLGVNANDSSFYFTGYSVVQDIWNDDTLEISNTNQTQIFLAKYTTEGSYEWAKAFPVHTITQKSFGPWGAMGTHLQVSDSGYVYFKGSFTGTMVFYQDTLYEDTTVVFSNQLADDIFLAKLDPNGDPIWGKYAGNGGGIGDQTGGFWVDQTGEVLYLVGFDADANNNKAIPSNPKKRMFIGREGAIDYTGLQEEQKESYRLFPNPSSNSITVNATVNLLGKQYAVFDIKGKVITSGIVKNKVLKLDVSTLENGVYLLSVGNEVMRFLKR
jgi:hypothetical protein